MALVFLLVAIPSLENRITPRGIVIHHTGWIGMPVDLVSLDEFHERSGYGIFYWGRTYHIGYHFLIYPSGRIEKGRPERAAGAHAKHHRDYLGIALVGNFSRKHNPRGTQGLGAPTHAQLEALATLTAKLQTTYDIPEKRVLVHRQVQATECPGDRFPAELFYRMIASAGQRARP